MLKERNLYHSLSSNAREEARHELLRDLFNLTLRNDSCHYLLHEMENILGVLQTIKKREKN